MSDSTAPPRRGAYGAALAGGLVGSAVTAAVLLFAAPQISGRIVRQGLIADPAILSDTVEALHDAQYAPVLPCRTD